MWDAELAGRPDGCQRCCLSLNSRELQPFTRNYSVWTVQRWCTASASLRGVGVLRAPGGRLSDKQASSSNPGGYAATLRGQEHATETACRVWSYERAGGGRGVCGRCTELRQLQWRRRERGVLASGPQGG